MDNNANSIFNKNKEYNANLNINKYNKNIYNNNVIGYNKNKFLYNSLMNVDYLISRPLKEQKRLLEQLFLNKEQDDNILNILYNTDRINNKANSNSTNVSNTYGNLPTNTNINHNNNIKESNLNKNKDKNKNILDKILIEKAKLQTVSFIDNYNNRSSNKNTEKELLNLTPEQGYTILNSKDPFSISNKNEGLHKELFISIGPLEEIKLFNYYKSSKKLIFLDKNLISNYNLSYWRRIKGDGNCFYRAIILNYIEIIIIESLKTKCLKYIINFIIDIYCTDLTILNQTKQENNSFSEIDKYLTISILIKILSLVECAIDDSSLSFASFDLLYRSFNLIETIQKSLIYYLRMKVANFILLNSENELNGLKIIESIGEYNYEINENKLTNKDIECYNELHISNYLKQNLLKMNSYAEGIALYATAIVLNVKLNIIHVNVNKNITKKVEFTFSEEELRNIINEDNKISLLNLNNLDYSIDLLFIEPHYDLLYTNKFALNLSSIYSHMNKNLLLVDKYNSKNNSKSLCKLGYQMDEDLYKKYVQNIQDNKLLFSDKNNAFYDNNLDISNNSYISINKFSDKELISLKDTTNANKNYNQTDIKSKNIKVVNIEKTSKLIKKCNSNNDDINNINYINKDSQDINSEKLELCSICLNSYNYVFQFPCSHTFCLHCFEINSIKVLDNYKNTNSLDISNRSLDSLLLSDVKKLLSYFKYFPCLNENECSNQFNIKVAYEMFLDYYDIKLGLSKEHRINNKENTIKNINCSYNSTNLVNDIKINDINSLKKENISNIKNKSDIQNLFLINKNYIINKLNEYKNTKTLSIEKKSICKLCNSYSKTILTSCKCCVCIACLNKKLLKNNNSNQLFEKNQDTKKIDINLKCMICKSMLSLKDYYKIFGYEYVYNNLNSTYLL